MQDVFGLCGVLWYTAHAPDPDRALEAVKNAAGGLAPGTALTYLNGVLTIRSCPPCYPVLS